VVASHQFLLGFRKVEGRAVGLGDTRTREADEGKELREDVPPRQELEAEDISVAGLSIHDLGQ